jgi:hypothetical protein
MLPAIAGMVDTHHHPQHFSIEMGSPDLLYPSWLGTMILLISASQVARITGTSHGQPACFLISKDLKQVSHVSIKNPSNAVLGGDLAFFFCFHPPKSHFYE